MALSVRCVGVLLLLSVAGCSGHGVDVYQLSNGDRVDCWYGVRNGIVGQGCTITMAVEQMVDGQRHELMTKAVVYDTAEYPVYGMVGRILNGAFVGTGIGVAGALTRTQDLIIRPGQ